MFEGLYQPSARSPPAIASKNASRRYNLATNLVALDALDYGGRFGRSFVNTKVALEILRGMVKPLIVLKTPRMHFRENCFDLQVREFHGQGHGLPLHDHDGSRSSSFRTVSSYTQGHWRSR